MRKSLGFLFAAMLTVVPVSLSAQKLSNGPRGRMGMRGNAASFVLEHKADLRLTNDQVRKLQDLVAQARALQVKNGPLLDEMRAAGKRPQEMTDAEREHYRPAMESMQKLMMQLMQILTPAQGEALRNLNPGGPRRSAAPTPQ